MNDTERILNKLLDKYEKSAHYRKDATQNRRVLLRLGSHSTDFKEYDIENYDRKIQIHTAVRSLQKSGLVGFKWEKFEEGNILSEVWLSLDNLQAAYFAARRVPKRMIVQDIMKEIRQILAEWGTFPETPDPGSWILAALSDLHDEMQSTQEIPAILPSDSEQAKAFLAGLAALSRAGSQGMSIRTFSLSVFRDSKIFEKDLMARTLSFIRKKCPDFSDIPLEEPVSDGELLGAVNLYQNPEIFEFCGPVQITFRDKRLHTTQTIDYGVFTHGAALHSQSLNDIVSIQISGVTKILMIENRTNYEEYISADGTHEELVVYHGGFHNRMKGRFLHDLVASTSPNTEIFHWGDIDLGGFKIFLQIQRDIAPNLKPHRMDKETLLSMKKYGVAYTPSYRKQLLTAHEDERYWIFSELLETMLETGIRLEQEAFLAAGK